MCIFRSRYPLVRLNPPLSYSLMVFNRKNTSNSFVSLPTGTVYGTLSLALVATTSGICQCIRVCRYYLFLSWNSTLPTNEPHLKSRYISHVPPPQHKGWWIFWTNSQQIHHHLLAWNEMKGVNLVDVLMGIRSWILLSLNLWKQINHVTSEKSKNKWWQHLGNLVQLPLSWRCLLKGFPFLIFHLGVTDLAMKCPETLMDSFEEPFTSQFKTHQGKALFLTIPNFFLNITMLFGVKSNEQNVSRPSCPCQNPIAITIHSHRYSYPKTKLSG